MEIEWRGAAGRMLGGGRTYVSSIRGLFRRSLRKISSLVLNDVIEHVDESHTVSWSRPFCRV